MGNNKFKLTKLALALGLTASLTACFSDNDDSVYTSDEKKQVLAEKSPTAVELQAGSINLVFFDTVSGSKVTEEITLTPSSSTNLVNFDGTEINAEDNTVSDGVYSIAVSEIPEDGLELEFVISSANYSGTKETVSLSADNGKHSNIIVLAPKTIPADAVVNIRAGQTSLTDLGATIAEDGTITTESGDAATFSQALPTTKTDQGGATVSIPSGVKMLTADDQPLTSAPTLALSYFSNEAATTNADEGNTNPTSALAAFPGGLDLSVPVGAAGSETTQSGSFTTGGFVAIELTDDEGNKVKSFGENNSIEVKMQVDRKTNNVCPMNFTGDLTQTTKEELIAWADNQANATNTAYFSQGACEVALNELAVTAVKAGDIIPVWSYNEDDGKWIFESYGVAVEQKDANGVVNEKVWDVAVNVDHLSYWNLDYFTYPIGNSCGFVSFKVQDSAGNANTLKNDFVIDSQLGGYQKTYKAYSWDNYSDINLYSAPAFPTVVKLTNKGDNVVDGYIKSDGTQVNLADNGAVNPIKLDSLCDLHGATVILSTAPATPVEQTFNTRLVCDTDAVIKAKPVNTPASVSIYEAGIPVFNKYSNGSFSVSLDSGVSYVAEYKNPTTKEILETTFTASGTAVNLDFPTVCETELVDVSGSGSGSGS